MLSTNTYNIPITFAPILAVDWSVTDRDKSIAIDILWNFNVFISTYGIVKKVIFIQFSRYRKIAFKNHK